MPLDVQVIERQPVPDGVRFWDAIARLVPLAFAPTAAQMQLRAPHGKTGKLARQVHVRAMPVRQGFIQGVEVQFIVGVPYGHLVSGGHRIVPRGATRFTKAARALAGNRALRASERTALKTRRIAGSQGFVPGNPFASQTLVQDRAAAIQRMEMALGAGRAV